MRMQELIFALVACYILSHTKEKWVKQKNRHEFWYEKHYGGIMYIYPTEHKQQLVQTAIFHLNSKTTW